MKGLKGELFARLVMILARNQIRSGPAFQDVIQASDKDDKAKERAPDSEEVHSPFGKEDPSTKTFLPG